MLSLLSAPQQRGGALEFSGEMLGWVLSGFSVGSQWVLSGFSVGSQRVLSEFSVGTHGFSVDVQEALKMVGVRSTWKNQMFPSQNAICS